MSRSSAVDSNLDSRWQGGLGLVIAAMILGVILSAALAVDSLTSDPETAKALWLVEQGAWTLVSPALATFVLGISVGAIRHGDLTAEAAAAYHGPQLRSLAEAGADFASVLTMTHAQEAVGVAQAAKDAGTTVSFTVETDGALPSGQSLQEAIKAVDAATDGYPDRYGIKCAHPEHFAERLSAGEGWCHRIGLVQANTSKMSHEELDETG